MVYQDFELPDPGPDQVQVKLEAIGVNFRTCTSAAASTR